MRNVLRGILLLFFLSPLAGAQEFSLQQVADLFPSEGLEDRIEFWKLIFTRYGEKDFVFHDIDDLGLIYRVVSLDEAPAKGDAAAARRQRKLLQMQLEELEEKFTEIRRQGIRSSSLTAEHRKLLAVIEKQGYRLNNSLLLRLGRNIRYQKGIQEKFQEGLVRSGYYLEHIEDVFGQYGLPLELSVLPHVESSFDYNAYSKAGAAGIWQFTRGTGRLYLRINRYIDERLDPLRATDGAARLLRDNFRDLASWPLAITAYNHGKYGMLRAQRQHGSDIRNIIEKYSSRTFGFASKNFYPEFLAALEVSRNYPRYFGELSVAPPLRYDAVRLDRARSVTYLTSVPKITPEVLMHYNPHLRLFFRSHNSNLPSGIEIRVPHGHGPQVLAALESAPAADSEVLIAEDGSMRYRVQWGDSLGGIASRFQTSLGDLQRLNGIRNVHRIYPGQVLLLSTGSAAVAPPGPAASRQRAEAGAVEYRVRPGDTLGRIARRHNTSVARIQAVNRISDPRRIRPGQILTLPEGSTGPTRYRVRPGDTLEKIALWFSTTIEAIRSINQIADADLIRNGQELTIP